MVIFVDGGDCVFDDVWKLFVEQYEYDVVEVELQYFLYCGMLYVYVVGDVVGQFDIVYCDVCGDG